MLFFGRQNELALLNELLKKRTASLVVIKGRRRIGKSRLAEVFGERLCTYTFEGLPVLKNVLKRIKTCLFCFAL